MIVSIPLIANQARTYTNTEVDNGLALAANPSAKLTRTEIDNALAHHATTPYVYGQLALKAQILARVSTHRRADLGTHAALRCDAVSCAWTTLTRVRSRTILR
jgi:hypothetical protein